MEVLLFFIVLLQLVIALIVLQNLVHPIIILKTLATFSTLVLIIYSNIWELSITLNTVFIFSSGLIWFDLGFILLSLIYGKRKYPKYTDTFVKRNEKEFSISGSILMFLVVVITMVLFLTYGRSYVQLGGGLETFSNSLIVLKNARSNGDINFGLLQYVITACTIIGIVYAYITIKEWLTNGFGIKIILFSLPVIATFSLFFLTGRRSFLLNVILIFLLLIFEYLRRKYRKIPLKVQLKLFFTIITTFAIFFSFFVVAGRLFLKGGEESDPFFNTIAVYLSGGIVAFDQVYQDLIFTSTIFGQNFFRIFYEVLNILPNFNFPTETINHTFYSNNLVTNVYTVNLHYMADFGYSGVIIGNILIGMFYAFLYIKGRNEETIGIWNLLYAFFLIYLISYTGSERFFTPMTINLQYMLMFLILLKTPLLYKKAVKNNRTRLRKSYVNKGEV